MKRLMTTLLFVLLCGTGLCLADGVTVSGTVTFTDLSGNQQEYGATGTVSLLNAEGGTAFSAQLETTEDNRYPHYSIANVTAGTYTLSFSGEGYGNIIKYSESDFVVKSTNIEKNIAATVDNTIGYWTLNIRFDANIFEYGYSYNSSPVVGATVTCTPKVTGNETATSVSAVSGTDGSVKFLVAKNAEQIYTIRVTTEIYMDTTFEMAAFTKNEYAPGGLVANNPYIYMREKSLPAVTVSGSVTKPTDMPSGLKLQLTTIKSKTLDAIDLTATYSFSGVPVGNGNTKLALYDPSNYSDYYHVYNYAITSPENGEFTVTGTDGGTFTQDITIAKVAANVTGKVKDVSSLNGRPTITLTKQGENSPAYTTNNVQSTGAFSIQGVKPGTYTVGARIDGYALKGTAPSVTVTDALADVAIADELEFEAADMEITFSINSLYLQNSTTYEMTYLKGAEVKLYAGNADITTVEPLATATADDYGSAYLYATGKLGAQFIVTVTHAAIKPAQQTVTVTSNYSSCSFYGLLEPSGTEVPTSPLLGIKDFTYTQLTDSTLTLSWNWPTEWQNANDYEVRNITLYRRTSSVSGEGTWRGTWDKGNLTFGQPFTMTDTVPETDEIYTYLFNIYYLQPNGTFDTSINVDLRVKHTLAYGVNDPAMGSIRTENEEGAHYMKGDKIVLIAEAKDGYKFMEWQRAWSLEAGAPIDPAYTTYKDSLAFYMPRSDIRQTAVFKKNRFVITLNVNPENAGSVSGGGTYEGDTTVTIKAVANEGYRFKAWMEGNEEVTTKAEYKFQPEDDRTLTAVFEEMKYVLGLGVNHAEWGKVEGAGEFAAGTEVTVKATANEGYKFVAWHEGEAEVSKEASYTFKMQAKDITLTAVFEDAAQQYTVTLEANNAEWGKVEGAGEFAEGTTVTIKATPNENYHFVAWKDGETEVSTTAVYSFKLEKDITLTAVFAEGSANEELEATRWQIYAENGTIVINGLSGDRYSVYDLNGRLAGQAFCTGAEIRIDVAPNKLYIVRRISAAGLFGAKKIVVH